MKQTVTLVIGVALVLPAVVFGQASNPASGSPAVTSATIFYSGRMMGYLRQDKANDPDSRTFPAKIFLDKYGAECTTRPCVLLGMGDNFAPKYEARINKDGNFKSRDGSDASYDKDDVAAFLYNAKFNALVPGKEDFYFGAYRLWKIAGSMHENNIAASQGGPFVADNLVLRPVDEKDREQWLDPTGRKPGNHVKKFTAHAAWVSSSFTGKAMPWLSKLTFTFDPPLKAEQVGSLQGKRCIGEKNPDDINPASDDCVAWKAAPKIDRKHPDVVQEVSFLRDVLVDKRSVDELERGRDYGFCITDPRHSVEPQYCLPIHVETPMFSSAYVQTDDGKVAIFAVVDTAIRSYIPKQNAGWDVLDPNAPNKVLKNSIRDPSEHTDWIPHRVEIAALPPQDALQQAMDAFVFDHHHQDFKGITVLMAQMDMDQADELARHMKAPDGMKLGDGAAPNSEDMAFDLVIAKADFSHQTREQTISVTASPTETRYRFVAVPPPAWTDDGTFQLPLGSAEITRGGPIGTAKYCIPALHSTSCAGPIDGKRISALQELNTRNTQFGLDELQRRLAQGIASTSKTYAGCYKVMGDSKLGYCSKNLSSCLMKFATCAMLQDNGTFDTEGSDVALLQPRDIWVPKADASQTELVEAETVQGVLDRIFWKDDLLSHANLSGSQLKALIKESTKFEDEEKNPLWILRDTTGRKLSDVGLLKGTEPKPGSKDSPYYAHLEELSDSSLYRVAASSFISNGDTGYVEFASPAQGKVELFRNNSAKDPAKAHPGKVGVRISVLVCEALKQGVEPNYEPLYHCGEPDIGDRKSTPFLVVDEASYAISSAETKQLGGLVVPDNREQDNHREYLEAQAKELTFGRDPFAKDSLTGQTRNQSEKDIQSYPYLDVNLQKMAIGGSLNTALASKAQTANLGGVLQSDIPQPTKGEVSWITQLRVLDRRGGWDIGPTLDAEFDKSMQARLAGPSSATFSADNVTLGPLLLQFSMSDPRKQPRRLLTFHLWDLQSQITDTNIALSGKANSASYILDVRRNYGYQPKWGYRYESGESYFEAGGIYVKNYRVLSEIAGLPPGYSDCILTATQSLAGCVSQIEFPAGFPAPILHYSNFQQGGIYWDGKLHIDVWKGKWTYEFTSKGTWNFAGDTVSALTRFDTRVGNSLNFPLFGNFSFAPMAEWRFFETQGTQDYIKRLNTMVQLNYNFHKDSRVKLWDAMKYKPSSATAP
jgi:hypothetical protein